MFLGSFLLYDISLLFSLYFKRNSIVTYQGMPIIGTGLE